MDIAQLIDYEVMHHLGRFGCIKNMDPFAQHLLKTSENPLLRFRRNWLRREALRQLQEGRANQEKHNDQLAQEPARRGASIRRMAVLDPYLMQEMAHRHGTSWGDKDFVNSVKAENPKLFPKRENY